MDFARKILANYGWKDGDGLGKNKDGIAKPLKATLKFDNAGFGADQAAADFNNHWWERVFNEAATNVNIQKEGEQIKMALKDEADGVEISTKGYSVKKLKKLKEKHGEEANKKKTGYENFLQSATLTNLGGEIENPDKIDVNDIEVTKVKVLTDEELFKACGGRTAHKGARHGLKLSGKLSRIEQQEAELLAKMMAKRNADDTSAISNKLETNQDDCKEQKLKKKKKKSKVREEEKLQDCANEISQDEVKQSKKKKKTKVREEVEPHELVNESSQVVEVNLSKKKKKRKHQEDECLEDEMCKKQKVKEANDCEESVNLEESSVGTIDNEISTLKKKKKKNKEDKNEAEEIVHKKKKKKNKNKDTE